MDARRSIERALIVLAALASPACGPPGTTPDASTDAACRLAVVVGRGGDAFVPYVAGDRAEIVLGFQGFQMLPLDVRVRGAPAGTEALEIAATVSIADTAVEGGRTDRAVSTVSRADALAVDGWLLFFNGAPVSQIAGHDGTLELIVHAGPCSGGVRVVLHLVDDVQCVDFDASVPDVGSRDAGLADGSLACGATP